MKKITLLLAVLLCSTFTLFAQNPNRVTIKGLAIDTIGEDLPFSTVMLLNPKDSTLINFTRSDDKGAFVFKNVKNSPYLLKISYVAYLPFQKYLPVSSTEVNDLGTLRMKPISTELMEVVIKTAKAPLRIKGDTIEYDATTFKVPPGSTVEDLLRRLPGMEVDADGNIRAQGKDVKRVYVDGKTFFGDDPKSATKNLGAETISKVQVYNEKSEQAKLTGVDDGVKEKAMNLELKDEYKKGSFGKITAAVGTEDRWAGRGNFNKFDPKQQLSFIGFGNNINQTGVNWEDYGEFKGQSTFGDNDNGDFGFSSNRRYYYWGGDDGPLNYFDGRGFTKNFGGGTNYNFDNKKTKFNASYFYNQTDLSLDQTAFKQTFFSDNSFTNADTMSRSEFRGNHTISTRLEQELDSSDVLIVKANMRFSQSDSRDLQSQLFSKEITGATNRLGIDNGSDMNSWRLTSTAIYRHRFKKKGRAFAASAGYNNTQSDGADNLFSLNKFFEANTPTQQIRQLNARNSTTEQVKSSLLYTDAFNKKWFWEVFYNFNNSLNTVDRRVDDPERNNQRIDSLSVYYNNKVLYNRLGSSIRYSHNGLNASAGLAAQQIQLTGKYAVAPGQPLITDPINRTFENLTPNVDVNYEIVNNTGINFSYNYGVSEPQLTDLQPVPNVNNPLYRTEGNPDLEPERSNNFDLGFNYWNPSNFANVSIGSEYKRYDSQIVYNSIIDVVDNLGVRTTMRPENLSGGNEFNMYLWTSFPIVKTKLTMNMNGNVNAGKAPAYVNGELNETTNRGYHAEAGFNFTPGQKLIMSLDGNFNVNNIEYSIQSSQNQKILNYGTSASVKWQFAPKTFFESNFNYDIYENDRFGFNQNIPIWNGSVRRIVGKSNRVEVRLAAFDLLNRRVSINQSANQNFVTREVSSTLARYFMLSVSYNVRGYENKLSKNNWW